MMVTEVGEGSGSGKTYPCSKVKQELPWKTLIFSMDRYYRPFNDLSDEERKEVNFEENTRTGYEKKESRGMIDIKLFLNPDPEVRAVRRMKRDIVNRDRDAEFAARQFLEMTHPAHQKHVEPKKKHADIVLDSPQVDRFVEAVTEKLRRKEKVAVEELENYIAEGV